VTYQPRQGIHDWPYWREHLKAAIQWGFFRPVAESPASWRYTTVSQDGRAWDLRFHFNEPPGTPETLVRDGSTLSGFGAGEVTIQPDHAAAFSAELPFTRTLEPLAAGSGPASPQSGSAPSRTLARCRSSTLTSRRTARRHGRRGARRRARRHRRARCRGARRVRRMRRAR